MDLILVNMCGGFERFMKNISFAPITESMRSRDYMKLLSQNDSVLPSEVDSPLTFLYDEWNWALVVKYSLEKKELVETKVAWFYSYKGRDYFWMLGNAHAGFLDPPKSWFPQDEPYYNAQEREDDLIFMHTLLTKDKVTTSTKKTNSKFTLKLQK